MEHVISTPSESNYSEILRQAVAVIESTRATAARAIVATTNHMHWEIGRLLYERKLDSAYGDSVVKRLSADLKKAYPNLGISVRNLWDMKRFYVRFYQSSSKLRQAVAVLPWWNINKLISLFEDDDAAILYYAEKTIEKSWSRELLMNAVKMEMHKHVPEKNVANNFASTLPALQAA